ncbi:hypothetical protein [Amycolatopsis japonica]|uniref:hypothetical protein n=1 Tax=Amycolatopsis japonica TaxID=208439 RepID=UPI0033D14FC6
MPLEIACDESGSEGEKLIGGQTGVFAHAGVRLSLEEATACLVELRRRIRSPAVEYKANHLLRTKHRRVLEWFLGPRGPVHGRAHVYLVDKKRLLANELRALAGPGIRPDDELLAAFNDVLRTRNRRDPAAGSFFAMAGNTAELRAKVGRARDARSLDPLVPAILRAIEYWSAGGEPVFPRPRRTTVAQRGPARPDRVESGIGRGEVRGFPDRSAGAGRRFPGRRRPPDRRGRIERER